MARPQKCRRICKYPDFWRFSPDEASDASVELTLDAYEAIRLIDWLGKTQSEAAAEMQVARTTVTAIYDSARRKIADALVNGKRIVISGGHYRIDRTDFGADIPEKGNHIMRIAVAYENGQVFQHFGHSSQFKFYDVENGAVVREEVVGTAGQGHGALAGFLKEAEADTLICGGIGGGAQMAMAEAGIKLYAGITGDADAAVQSLLAGTLPEHDGATCRHHGEDHRCGDHHHGEDHRCGEHGHDAHGHGERHRHGAHG